MSTAIASFFDEQLAAAADRAASGAVAMLLDAKASIAVDGHLYHVVIVAAPAGAGKTEFVCSVAEAALDRNPLRSGVILIGTPTNDQAYELVRRIALRIGLSRIVAFIPASGRALPSATANLSNVVEVDAAQAHHYPVVVGTLDKLGDAHGRGSLMPGFNYLVIDEAYQAHSAQYFGVAGLADRHLLVGDPGQLDPFTTMAEPERWRGLPEDPVQTAVAVVLGNHPGIPLIRLPITRRLPASALPIVSAFYPNHAFGSWTLPTARELQLLPAIGRGQSVPVDAALDEAARTGWAYLRQPHSPVLTADPSTVDLICRLARRLGERGPKVSSERTQGALVPISLERVAVAVSHNDQKDMVRAALDSAQLPAVRVDTANKLQGLEFDLVIAWHPLAGLPDPDGFHLDPGRLCVMLTRHRHACIVVGRIGDVDLLDAAPPSGEAWLGYESSPEVDGWFAHRAVFDQLGRHAVNT